MTHFDYLDSIISGMVDEIEDKIEEEGFYKLGAMKYLILELKQRIKKYSNSNFVRKM